jgi:hypothetical protein
MSAGKLATRTAATDRKPGSATAVTTHTKKLMYASQITHLSKTGSKIPDARNLPGKFGQEGSPLRPLQRVNDDDDDNGSTGVLVGARLEYEGIDEHMRNLEDILARFADGFDGGKVHIHELCKKTQGFVYGL